MEVDGVGHFEGTERHEGTDGLGEGEEGLWLGWREGRETGLVRNLLR